MPKDEVTLVLEKYGIEYNGMEDSNYTDMPKDERPVKPDYILFFYLFDDQITFYFDEENDVINGIGITGYTPLDVTATQSGLNIRDSFDKMIELYGNDYTVVEYKDPLIDFSDQVYKYKIGNLFLEVWYNTYEPDEVSEWRISAT